MEKSTYIFSVDAETNGLWGQPFAIGAVVYKNGVEVNRFQARMPDSVVDNQWVKENVLPALDMPVTHDSYERMLWEFSRFYFMHKDATVLWHMGHVVEAFLFRECVRLGFLGEWDAPYTPIEVSETLRLAGQNADSVDKYLHAYMIEKPQGSSHNPVFDCICAFLCWDHLTRA
jgi:hypothetical protein